MGGRPRGSVIGDIPPERTFRPADIRAFGADDVEALLDAIGAQTASNRGRGDDGPVTLLNGRRVSNFSEIARIPAEAIERMEILPEEVALKYGYRADQKVVNVVTFQRYQAGIGEAGLLAATRGDRTTGDADADFLRIRDETRFALGASYSRSTPLLESERNVRQLAGQTGVGRFRTLLPSTERFLLNGLVSGPVLGETSATVNGRFEANRSRSLVGRGEDGALRRDSDGDTTHLGTTLAGRTGTWQWTALGTYDRIASRMRTDLGDRSAPRDTARSIDSAVTADLILSGPIVNLPAGPLYASVRGGIEFRDFESRSGRSPSSARSDIGRDKGGLQANVDVPLLGSADQAASGIGRLSANANVAIDRLSDTGSMATFGAGLNWSPIRAIGIILSGTSEQGPPTLDQLGGPALVTPNVRTFDIARGEVVDVTQVSGGNPRLRSDERHVVRLGLNLRPLSRTDLTLSLDYVAAHVDDPIVAFPIVSPQVEAAFPERFLRDATGRLLQIDARPINFAASRQKQLRWGVNLTKPLGAVPSGMDGGMIRIPAEQAGQMTRGPNGTFTFRPQPGSAFARNIMTASSRLFVSLYHNWFLEDSLRLRGGLPSLDLLDGGATDANGGRRRHEIEFQAGAFKRGLGARLSASWRSGTEVDGAQGTADGLRFGSLTTVNLSLFANLAERFGGAQTPSWLKGTRVTFDIANLLDSRPDVRDRLGTTPLRYQRAYLDPLGRTISLRLRRAL
ncbi:TonB-dependent receptor [Sphingomonas sp. ac-8]|uniref:TonB-dependent receptor n=1 Tax=Sphingomonas sp. ac-8 TaxID=3242977 RepID=UPI003A8005AE